ncbi:MAG: alpha/beta hydrolase [Alphaproteobacteria bacterium]
MPVPFLRKPMLTDHSVDPKNGKPPEYLVIFFHGYGSNGELMAEQVGSLLGPLLPEAKIRCPDGPIEFYKMPDGKSGCSWFEIRDLFDGDNLPEDRGEIARRASAAAKEMNDYIDKVIAEEGISKDRVIIAGYSQGGTMAFYTGLLRDEAVAGVYALSGGALDLLEHPVSKPPVGLVAGGREAQDYSGFPQAQKTHKALDAAGFFTDCVVIPDQGHNLSWKSMELLSVFTRAVTSDGFKAKVAAEQDNLPAKKIHRPRSPRP